MPTSDLPGAASAPVPLNLSTHEVDGPTWVEMLRTGDFRSRFRGGTSASGHSGARFTRDDLESAARGFRALAEEGYLIDGGAPVGYEHSEASQAWRMVHGEDPDEGELKKAAAWFSQVTVKKNDDGGYSLMGLHNWTDEGRQRVRGGGYKGYSINIAPPGRVVRADGTPINEWVPYGGTLTNSPFIRGMEPLAASEETPETNMTTILNSLAVLTALSLSESASESDIVGEINDLKARADKAEIDAKSWESAANLALSERDEAKAALEALSERQKELTIKQAVHEERISLSESEDYWAAFSSLGEEWANRHFNEGRVPQQARVREPAAPKEREVQGEGGGETADDRFDRLYSEHINGGKSRQEAYDLAAEATFADRSLAYRTTPTA